MANDSSHIASFSAAGKWAAVLNVLVSCASLLALVVMVNYLASRHFKRYQWMADERYRLSPMTMKMLDALTNRVKVIVFFNPDNSLFSSVKGLLNEYRLACPKLDVEFVDYLHAPGRAELIKTQYKIVSATDDNFVIFDSKGTFKLVYERNCPITISPAFWLARKPDGPRSRANSFSPRPSSASRTRSRSRHIFCKGTANTRQTARTTRQGISSSDACCWTRIFRSSRSRC